MMRLLTRLFGRVEPSFVDARPFDAPAFATLHAAAFRRGWSNEEMERLLLDRNVVAHRAALGRDTAGFILSRRAADEAEILSVAVARKRQSKGIARRLLDLHLRRLAGMGTRAVFLEVDEHNTPARRLYARAGFQQVGRREGYYPQADGRPSAAVILRRDLN